MEERKQEVVRRVTVRRKMISKNFGWKGCTLPIKVEDN